MEDSLTKENFWNKLYEKYTGEVQQFCDWIDEYKKRVEWNLIFRERHGRDAEENVTYQKPKYHDLPIGMQIGIFIQYTQETADSHRFEFSPDVRDMEVFAQSIEEWFHEEHEWALMQHQESKMEG